MHLTSLYKHCASAPLRFLATAVCAFIVTLAMAQPLPSKDGERARYSVQIDIRQAYISGICGMLYEDGVLKASIINEFGVSAMDFQYDTAKDKVKIISVIKNLDHWYIKRVLRRDLRALIHNMQQGENRYEDAKYKITYTFTPMKVGQDD